MSAQAGLTLVLDPEGHDLSGLFSALLARGHIVATRRNAFDCLSYVLKHHPTLVLIRPTSLPGEAERIGEAVRKFSSQSRVVILGREDGEAFPRTVQRAIDRETRSLLAAPGA